MEKSHQWYCISYAVLFHTALKLVWIIEINIKPFTGKGQRLQKCLKLYQSESSRVKGAERWLSLKKIF